MNTAVAPQRWEGEIVDGKFRLLQWLGGTGQSTVFRTEIPGHGREAAIKLVPASGASAEQLSRWQAAAGLSHPNLLHIFASGNCRINQSPLIYVVMELADEDLSEVLPQRPLSAKEVEQMMTPLLDVLGYIHRKGLVHGRVQPSNILAVGDSLKLSSDNLHSPDTPVKRDALSVYDAPEIAIGAATPAADVWSLGATLVTALTQKPPAWDRKILADPVVPESLPAPFLQIALDCLRKNPAERCTLEQVQTRLKTAARPTVEKAPEATPTPPKRNLLKIVAPLAAIILVIAFFAMRGMNRGTPSEPASNPVQNAEAPSGGAAPASPTASAGTSQRFVQGAVVERAMPDVSRSARMTIHGKIRVRVHVDVSPVGGVSEASLITAGPSQYFANKALQASLKWKFQPTDAPSQWVIQYLFGRSGTEISQQQIKP
jgi:serine/threonine protein kinase